MSKTFPAVDAAAGLYAGQMPANTPLKGGRMYVKPKLEVFGSLRELTLVGFDPDCDGGVFGISSVGNGDYIGCPTRS